MRNRTAALLALVLAVSLLFGCSGAKEEIQQTTEATVGPTVPADGNPKDVTCMGSYTEKGSMNDVVAKVEAYDLTNEQLQAWYWAAAASYRNQGQGQMPDFEAPLDTQPCPIDDSVNSWQQYFLKQALTNWHTAQALYAQSQEAGLPVEEAFAPVENYRQGNISEALPAIRFMYREKTEYVPNTMHQAYLDGIPELLDSLASQRGYASGEAMAGFAFGTSKKALEDMVKLYNWGYMYHTDLSFYIENTEEELEAWYEENEAEYNALGIAKDSGYSVDIRQILLVPEASQLHPDLTVEVGEDGKVTCDELLWEECQAQARKLVKKWSSGGRPRSEGTFSDLAYWNSLDTGTAADGGAYRRIEKGQLIPELDEWCFDESRKDKDVDTIRTEYGVHILFFAGKTDTWEIRSREDLTAQKQRQQILDAREAYPMTVDYTAITLTQADGAVGMDALLYPDVAHERFPEVPVYLQQDYPGVMYGAYQLRTHGCGITSLAMLATYMTDDELTPPELCARYGHYNTEDGTDVSLFAYEPAAMGFYNRLVYRPDEALQALKDGYMVISLQKEGYWTRGGHYIVLEKIFEDERVQVRDSNVFNYGKLEAHKEDKHAWKDVTRSNKVMWVFEKKLTRVEACSRCGDRQGISESLLTSDYLCHKCRPALLRRNAYLSVIG